MRRQEVHSTTRQPVPPTLEPAKGDCQRPGRFAASMHPGLCRRVVSRFEGPAEHPANGDEKRLEALRSHGGHTTATCGDIQESKLDSAVLKMNDLDSTEPR